MAVITTPVKATIPTTDSSIPKDSSDSPILTSSTNRETMAVGLVAFGNATKNRIVERAIRSVRAKGRWKGWVFVITDHPERFASLEATDDHFVAIHPPAKDWQDRPEHQYRHITMKFKEFKTFLVEYLDLDDRLQHVDRVLYMDIDIVVCNSLENWVDNVFRNFLPQTWTPESQDSFMLMYHRARNICHSGVLLLSRQHSRGCLDEWRRRFHKQPYIPRDQTLIKLMNKAGSNKTNCRLACMPLETREMVFPFASDLVISTTQNGEPQHRCKQFFHITNTHHAKQSNASVQQEFLEVVLELSPEERQSNDSLAHFQGTF